MKDRFISLLHETNRPGIDHVIKYLTEKTDFFTAPASTQYHGAEEGGLVVHSLAVYDNLVKIKQVFSPDINPESLVITALLHDICKANFYKSSTKNVKNEETNKWEKVPFYKIEDQLPLGHGEKSVILLQQMMRLTLEEIMAIRWHMGLSDTDYATRKGMSRAFDEYPLVLMLHMADMAASYFDKK